jgi:hypothetical protein
MRDAVDLSHRIVVNSEFSPLRVGASLRAIAEASDAVEGVREFFRRWFWRGKVEYLNKDQPTPVRILAFEAAFEGRDIETIPYEVERWSRADEIVTRFRADDPSFIQTLRLHAPSPCAVSQIREGPRFGPLELAKLGVDVSRVFLECCRVGELAVLLGAERCVSQLVLGLWPIKLLTVARLNGDTKMEQLLFECGVEPWALPPADGQALGIHAAWVETVVASGNARAARRLVGEGRCLAEFAAFTGLCDGKAWRGVVLKAVPSAQEPLGRAARRAGYPEDLICGAKEFALHGGPVGAFRCLARELELGRRVHGRPGTRSSADTSGTPRQRR